MADANTQATVLMLFQRVQPGRYRSLQYLRPSADAASNAARALFIGTLHMRVTPKAPMTYINADTMKGAGAFTVK